MHRAPVPLLALLVLVLAAPACRLHREVALEFKAPEGSERVSFYGLDACTDDGPAVVELDPSKPLTVLVHGCTSSGARFKTLAGVFEAHGQQTICFNYNDRDWINTSSVQLINALEVLEQHFEPTQITVLGHSQGGLVARRALVEKRRFALEPDDDFRYRLVTVSSPFGGIASSADCGKVWLHVVSLSITVGVCMAITGNKWTEIYPGSEFMTDPGRLAGAVASHLVIRTDERGTCRAYDEDGTCEQDDEVFSLAEQANPAVDDDPRATLVTLRAGHAEIVGETGEPPTKLLQALQASGVLARTPRHREREIAHLVRALFAP